MASVLEWIFRMRDQVSPGARSASRSVGDFLQSVHSGLAVLDYAVRGVRMLGSAMSDALQPAMFRETTLLGFETLLGDTEKAAKMYREAVSFAAVTPFQTKQVVDSYQKLLVSGFKETEIPIVLKGVGDLASLKGFSQEVIDRVTLAFGQIKSKGRLMGQEMLQLAEAGVPQGAVYERLGKIYGVTAQQAIKMQEAGRIGADAGIFAIMETLKDVTSGGKLGSNMEKTSRSITGLVSTLKSRPFEFLQQLGEVSGYERLRESLSRLTKEFNPASESGRVLSDVLMDIGSGTLERISVMLEYLTEGASSFFTGLKAGLGPLDTAFGPTNQDNLEKFRIIMEGIGDFTGKTAIAFGKLSDKIGEAWDYFYKIGQWWANNRTVADWLDKWVAPLFGEEQTTGTRKGTSQPELVAQKYRRSQGLEVASVSGGMATITVPAMADGGLISSPTLILAGERGPEYVVPAGSAGGPTINLSFSYQGGGGREEAEDIERRVEAGIRAALERWQLQSGRRFA